MQAGGDTGISLSDMVYNTHGYTVQKYSMYRTMVYLHYMVVHGMYSTWFASCTFSLYMVFIYTVNALYMYILFNMSYIHVWFYCTLRTATWFYIVHAFSLFNMVSLYMVFIYTVNALYICTFYST